MSNVVHLRPYSEWDDIDYFLGVDLGQAHDPTAIALIERHRSMHSRKGETGRRLDLRHLERLPLGTPYPAQVARVGELHARLPTGTKIIVDRTGVGRAVFDIFKEHGIKATAIDITAGAAETSTDDGWRVAKVQLVSRLQALLHEGKLRIAKDMPNTQALERELQDFRANFTAAGNVTFSAREGAHDDLVLAVAIAAWVAMNRAGNMGIKKLGGF